MGQVLAGVLQTSYLSICSFATGGLDTPLPPVLATLNSQKLKCGLLSCICTHSVDDLGQFIHILHVHNSYIFTYTLEFFSEIQTLLANCYFLSLHLNI